MTEVQLFAGRWAQQQARAAMAVAAAPSPVATLSP
jgi:hypothetical protein